MDSDATNHKNTRLSKFIPNRHAEAQLRNRARQQRLDGARITKTDKELIAEAIAAGRITRGGDGGAESE